MTRLPTDHEVADQLARARLEVLDATHRVRSPRRSTRYRFTRNLLVGGAIAAVLTGGAIVAVTASSTDIATFATCYEAPTLSATHIDVVEDVADPIDACAGLWRLGQLGQSAPVDPLENPDFPVPELVACEQPNGVAAVFPREDAESDQGLCEALGLAVRGSD